MHTPVWQRLILIALLAAVGTVSHAEPPAAPSAPATDANLARRSQVVATYDTAAGSGTGKITVGDLEAAVKAAGSFTEQRYLDAATLKSLLDRAVRFELLATEAARRGYDDNDSVNQAVKQNAVQAMLKQEVDTKVTPKTVAPEAVQKYYDEHIDEFVRPEMRRASQLQLAKEDEAQALLEQAKAADMRSFRELARLRSLDEVSKLRGGDLRYFDAKGKPDEAAPALDPALAKAAFALKTVGDTSGVVKTDAGYSILRLTGMRAAHSESVKEADERIRMRLWREQREAAIDAMLTGLKTHSPPTPHPELLDSIVLLPDAPDSPRPPNAGLPAGFPHTKPPQVPFPKE